MYDYLALVGSLEDRSQAFVIKRVGWLAAWNPCRPEGYMEMALDSREERQVAKVSAVSCGWRCVSCCHHVCLCLWKLFDLVFLGRGLVILIGS